MLVVALCNQKGGVGKTTTAVNIARAAHLRGIKTLIADLDHQANTTTTLLGRDPDDAGLESLADVLSARTPTVAEDVIVETGWKFVDVLPSGGTVLADVGSELVTMGPGREHRLSEALQSLTGYELVLLDCPPSLDLLTINGLTAAHQAVVVTTAELWSSNGIARLQSTIGTVRTYSNPRLQLVGVIVNALDRTRRQRNWLAMLQENGPAPVWEPQVQKATWIAEAMEAGVGLDEWDTPAATNLQSVYDGYLTTILGERP